MPVDFWQGSFTAPVIFMPVFIGVLMMLFTIVFVEVLTMVFMKVFMEVFMKVFIKDHPVCWTGCQMYIQNEFCTST
jgi:hypothetical protein